MYLSTKISLPQNVSSIYSCGLMMLPSLIGVVMLYPLVVKITKNYLDRKIKNKDVESILSYGEKLQAEAAVKED